MRCIVWYPLVVVATVFLPACADRSLPTAGNDAVRPQFIVNGVPDGNGHPNVGALLYDFDGDGVATANDLLCSGTFIGTGLNGADVFLTAAHCVAGFPSGAQFWVSFDADLVQGGVGSPITATGFVFDPQFGHSFANLHDHALVFLPAGSAIGITPAHLPPAAYLDQRASQGGLRGTSFVNVGYGVNALFKRAPVRFAYDGKRNVSTSPFMALIENWLGLLMNQDATGQGGDCFGDSGSPKFVPGTNLIVATVTTGDPNCRATSWSYRLDTQSARSFLAAYLSLP